MAAAPIDFGNEVDAGAEFEAPEQQAQETPESGAQQTPGAVEGAQQTEQPVDGRRGPANIRNSIKAASEALPEQAQAFKELGNAYFREQAYKQHFPTPQEAASAKQLIEGIGGTEGAVKLQERIQGYDTQEAGLESGNPAVLDSFFEDYPQGASALAPHYLEKLGQTNPQALAAVIAPHAIGMLESAGVGSHLDAILAEQDPARAKALVQQLQQWFQQQAQGAKQPPAQKNPGQEKITQQQQELDEQRKQIYNDRVSERVNSATSPELKKYVDQYSKTYKLNDKQKARFEASLGNRVAEEMRQDQTYLDQAKLRRQNKATTPEQMASFMSSEFNRRIKDAAYAEAQEIWGAPKGGTPQETGVVRADAPKTAPNGGPMFVSQRPQDSEFAQYPGLEMDIIQGRAKLKNGRFVTWRK